jgi:mRNA-degrading endonuclease RelE of RelBE toxin-antitoxin system
MELKFHPQAKNELKQLGNGKRQFVWNRLEELKDKPIPQSSGIIRVEGREVFKLKLKHRKREINHRVIYDIQDDKLRIFQIFHRQKGYDKENIGDRF